MELQKLKMPFRNTCAECGAVLEQGDEVYAQDMNAVVSGKGICKKHVKDEAPAVTTETPATEEPVLKSRGEGWSTSLADSEEEPAQPAPLPRRKAKAQKS